MLVLQRMWNESIIIRAGNDTIEIVVVRLNQQSVRLGINAPKSVLVDRKEIYEAKQKEKAANDG